MRLLVLISSLLLVLVSAACSEGGADSAGGFGKAEVKNPGVNVKQAKEPVQELPDFATAMKLTPKMEGGKLTVQVALKDGYHAYAQGEEIGKPVAVSVKETGGWKADGAPELPTGKTKDLGELGKSQVLEGTFVLAQKCVGGTGELEGELEIQICTDNACDRPRKHAFKAPAPTS